MLVIIAVSPQKEVKRLENEVMVIQLLNRLSTRFLCSARVKHMHKLPKQLVTEISVTYTDERYRKYTCYLSTKGPLVYKPHVIDGFS